MYAHKQLKWGYHLGAAATLHMYTQPLVLQWVCMFLHKYLCIATRCTYEWSRFFWLMYWCDCQESKKITAPWHVPGSTLGSNRLSTLNKTCFVVIHLRWTNHCYSSSACDQECFIHCNGHGDYQCNSHSTVGRCELLQHYSTSQCTLACTYDIVHCMNIVHIL